MPAIDTTGEPNLHPNWRGALGKGLVMQLGDDFEQRIGHCWARGRLREGDLVLCMGQAGDHFHSWYLLEHSTGTAPGGDGKPVPTLFLKLVPAPFGAYTMGTAICRLSPEDVLDIVDSGEVQIDLPEDYRR